MGCCLAVDHEVYQVAMHLIIFSVVLLDIVWRVTDMVPPQPIDIIPVSRPDTLDRNTQGHSTATTGRYASGSVIRLTVPDTADLRGNTNIRVT